MAMTDEVRKPQHYKDAPKKKKSFSEAFIPRKGDSKSELISKIISLFFIAVVIVCCVILGKTLYENIEAKQNQKKIQTAFNQAMAMQNSGVSSAENAVTSAAPSASGGEDISQPEAERKPLVVSPAAAEMLEINPDYAGYIYIPDVLSEAVVQSSDDKYYLKHNFYGQTRQCGTVFAGSNCTVNDYEQSGNITLYGHNQRDGTMFGNLDYYAWDYKYWLKNPFIYFDNKYESGTYVIVSSFIINTLPEHDNGNVFDYQNFADFQKKGKYTAENFITEITERSHFLTGIDLNENDKFLTLSTCSYEWDEARHVIVARKLRSGETTENIDTTNFRVNPNPKWPAIYYKYNGGSYSG